MDAAEYAERWLTAKVQVDKATGILKTLVADVAEKLSKGDRTEVISSTMNTINSGRFDPGDVGIVGEWLAITIAVLAEKGWHEEVQND